MRRRKVEKVPDGRKSRTSPVGGKRGCLCSDGKSYSRRCCDGSLPAQGIGVG